MKKSPAQIVKEQFGEKQKLVEAVQEFVNNQDLWVSRTNDDKGLARISNAKLLRLLQTFRTVSSTFGTRAKLVDAVLEAGGSSKDSGQRTRVESWPVPRLYDAYLSLDRKRKAAAAAKAKA